MFRVGQDQCLPGLGIEDFTGQLEQFLGRGRGRARRGARGETDRLAGVGVEHEESLSGLGRPFRSSWRWSAHVALAEAAYAVGIDGQEPSLEMARGAADLAQGDLKSQAVGHGAGPEKFVDGHVAGEERQAVGQLEDLLVQGAAVPQPSAAQRRLVDQLQAPGAVRRFGRFRSSRTPGPRPPGAAIRGPAARCRPGFP